MADRCTPAITMMALVALLIGLPEAAAELADQPPTARQIIDQQLALHALAHEREIVEMELISKRGKTKNRRLERYSSRSAEGLERMLAVITEPDNVRGTGVLLVQREHGEDEQWLHMPALSKVKKVAASDRKNRFMGTDFTYGDLRAEDPDSNTYSIVGEETVDGRLCWIIEALPASPEEAKATGYGKRRLWVAQEIFFPLKVELFDTRDRLVKVLVNRNLKVVTETAWRAEEMEMRTVRNGHRSVMRVLSRDLSSVPDEALFTVSGLVSFSK